MRSRIIYYIYKGGVIGPFTVNTESQHVPLAVHDLFYSALELYHESLPLRKIVQDMAAQTTPLRAQDLTQQPIPKLLVHTQDQHHTSHPSNSSQAFTGLYGHWKEFEGTYDVSIAYITNAYTCMAKLTLISSTEEVRNTFHGQANNWTNAVIAYSQPSHFSNEQVYCNNEAGVLGRFQHHVGQVMTCVGHDLRMQLRFGDWHDTTAERKADTTIWDAAGKPVVAGEAKTPWTLDLQELIDPAFTTQARFEALFPGKIGQVAGAYSSLSEAACVLFSLHIHPCKHWAPILEHTHGFLPSKYVRRTGKEANVSLPTWSVRVRRSCESNSSFGRIAVSTSC